MYTVEEHGEEEKHYCVPPESLEGRELQFWRGKVFHHPAGPEMLSSVFFFFSESLFESLFAALWVIMSSNT